MILDIIVSTFDLGVIVFLSFLITYIAAYKLLNDYFITKIQSRLFFFLGLTFYGAGHLLWSLNYFKMFPERAVLPILFIYVNLSGGIAMTLFLYAGINDYYSGLSTLLNDKYRILRFLAVLYSIMYIVITFLFAFIFEENTDLMIFVHPNDRSYTFNMSIWAAWLLIIPSFILAALYFKKKSFVFKDHNSSFYISLYFLLYALLLIIWPYQNLKYVFYVGKTTITFLLFWGVRELATESIIKEKMRIAEKERSFLLDLLSHDIKNYLNNISMALGLMEFTNSEERDNDITNFEKYKEIIATTLHRTSKLLDDINHFRRITNSIQKEKQDLYPVNARKRLLQTIKNIKDSYTDGNHEITVNFVQKDKRFIVQGNELIDVIFNNLLTNALRHNNSDLKQINISVKRFGRYIEIVISDNGPGIPQNLKGVIFKDTIKKNGRTRFGAHIVGKIVNWYEGTVFVDYNYETGAKVVLRLKRPQYSKKSFFKQYNA